MPLAELDRRARLWADAIGGEVIDSQSLIGGGSLPGATLPTRVLALGDAKKPALAQKMARRLRLQNPPIVGRLNEGLLLLDPRTVMVEQDEIVIKVLKQMVP